MGKRKKTHGKRNGILIVLLLALFAAGLGGHEGKNDMPELQQSENSAVFEVSGSAETEKQDSGEETEEPSAIPDTAIPTLSVDEIPDYSGEEAVEINGNVPDFTESDYDENVFEQYSPLDDLGRCGTAYACVGEEIMPTEERGAIGMVKPSGWHTVKYDFVDGKYLYNRCHLIAYQLSGENANTENLITGTRYLNTEGMLPYENQVADYVHDTGNHVLYRVTPLYEGGNLVASGVEIEASSLEDKGESLSFHVYCYNVQPGVAIDYTDGSSALAEDYQASADVQDTEAETEVSEVNISDTGVTAAVQEESFTGQDDNDVTEKQDYVLNKNTKKFHYPWCSSADDIKAKNRKDFTGTRQEVINQGYEPCKRCNP